MTRTCGGLGVVVALAAVTVLTACNGELPTATSLPAGLALAAGSEGEHEEPDPRIPPVCHGSTATIWWNMPADLIPAGATIRPTVPGEDDGHHSAAGEEEEEGEAPGYFIAGTTAHDVIVGSHKRDSISGGNGDDVVCADPPSSDEDAGHDTGGHDTGGHEGGGGSSGHGGGGPDHVWGGNGNDRIYGGGGPDSIYAGNGNDLVYAGGGPDLVTGDNGDDTLYGGPGPDRLHGGNGNDALFGEVANDQLFGELGDDQLHGGGGWDILDGGKGTNLIDPGPQTDDHAVIALADPPEPSQRHPHRPLEGASLRPNRLQWVGNTAGHLPRFGSEAHV